MTVTNTADSGPGSLRQAILDANVSPGNTVAFAIGTGAQRIRPLSPLPPTFALVDGMTQPGYSGMPLIEIDCSLAGGICVAASAGGILKALVVNRSTYVGVELDNSSLVSSYIGTDATGQLARPNVIGVSVISGTVGGPSLGEGNVISGNSTGIRFFVGPGMVVGNLIGTNKDGTAALPNIYGIYCSSAANVRIGGSSPGARNVISGNTGDGIYLYSVTDSMIQGNVIGPPASGNAVLGNSYCGVRIDTSSRILVGGPSSGNIISQNSKGVCVVFSAVRNTISANSIYGNAFGIDLNNDGVTPNDPCDADVGPNLLQNYPVISSATRIPGSVTVAGTLNSEASSDLDLEFFASPFANSSGYGEGQNYLGRLHVATDSSCNASFAGTFAADVPGGYVITATATDAFGDTSEFSAAVPVVAPAPADFFTLTPCRLIDTRNPSGPLGGPSLVAGAVRAFAVATNCGIPIDARALSVNIAVTRPTALGFLILSDGAMPQPVVSSINYRPGQTRANNAVVHLGPNGDLSIFCGQGSGTVDLILDVSGYFQ